MPPQSASSNPRIALVTGAARRIGQAIAVALAEDGWDVAIHCHRSRADAETTAGLIEGLGRRAVILSADLADSEAVAALVPSCVERLGVPSLLVNNASLFEFDRPESFSAECFAQHAGPNLVAPLTLAKAVFDHTPDGAQGCVVNVLDQKLAALNPDFFSYTLTKAALQAATTMMAQAFAPKLRVVAVSPGISLPSGGQNDGEFAAAHRQTVLGAASSPADVAAAVVFLARARAVTGTTVLVDGGQHLTPTPRDVMFLT